MLQHLEGEKAKSDKKQDEQQHAPSRPETLSADKYPVHIALSAAAELRAEKLLLALDYRPKVPPETCSIILPRLKRVGWGDGTKSRCLSVETRSTAVRSVEKHFP